MKIILRIINWAIMQVAVFYLVALGHFLQLSGKFITEGANKNCIVHVLRSYRCHMF